jgi:cysteine desulfurase
MIYMDHNATTSVRGEVMKAMWHFYETEWGNASSIHWAGRAPAAAIDDARDSVAALIGAPPRDLFFTSGGTEADNTALHGVLWANRDKGRHIIISLVEHKAILDMATYLESAHDCEITRLSVDSRGRHDLDELRDAIREDTILVSVMLANNEIGNVNRIAEMSEIAHERGVLMHTDAVNALGKHRFDVKTLGVDLMSISAHKIYGPKGVGALYVKRKTPFQPMILGGGQERGRRCGTYNTAGIVGFGEAARRVAQDMEEGLIERLAELRDLLERRIRDRVDDLEFNGDLDSRLPNTLNLSFGSADGEALVLNLDLRGIAISTGSACTSGSLDPSHVLVALEKDERWLDAAIRFSLGRGTTVAEVETVAEAVAEEVERLREVARSA